VLRIKAIAEVNRVLRTDEQSAFAEKLIVTGAMR
jgi:hypothetical protein